MRALLGRRLGLSAVVGLVVSTLLAGCSSGTVATGKPVTVTTLNGFGPITFATGKLDTHSYLPPLLQQWNAAHPNQRVTLISLPELADDQHAQLVANLQTRSDISTS